MLLTIVQTMLWELMLYTFAMMDIIRNLEAPREEFVWMMMEWMLLEYSIILILNLLIALVGSMIILGQ